MLLDLVELLVVIREFELAAEFSSEVVSLEVNECCLIDSSASSKLLVLLIAAEVLVSVLLVDELFTVDT